jgi:hypothetical protein
MSYIRLKGVVPAVPAAPRPEDEEGADGAVPEITFVFVNT